VSGRHELAVREMRRAETLNPQSVSLYTAFALCLRNARCYKEGAEKLRRALVLQPDNPTALQGFNWFVPYLKNYEEAEAACLKAVENNQAARPSALRLRLRAGDNRQTRRGAENC